MAAAAFAERLASLMTGEELAFIGLPSKETKQVSGSAEELIRNIGQILGELIRTAIQKHTAAEFIALRDDVFPNYAQVMLGLSRLVSAIVPHDALVRLNAESLCEMEADFRDHALAAFGPVIQDQAVFTIWTLRKIADLSQRILANPKVNPELKERDKELGTMFVYHGLRTRFHLDCLSTSMHSDLPIYPEVLNVISEGLRSAVDAYGWVKQGADLRQKAEEPVIEPIELDDEDSVFLRASAYDMAADPQ